MQYFRKKAVVIVAKQFNNNADEIIQWTAGSETPAFIDESIGGADDGSGHPQKYSRLKIATKEGDMNVDTGDFVIRGVKGEHYACKPDIMALTYEECEAPEKSN